MAGGEEAPLGLVGGHAEVCPGPDVQDGELPDNFIFYFINDVTINYYYINIKCMSCVRKSRKNNGI